MARGSKGALRNRQGRREVKRQEKMEKKTWKEGGEVKRKSACRWMKPDEGWKRVEIQKKGEYILFEQDDMQR